MNDPIPTGCPNIKSVEQGTHTRQLDAAVTALGSRGLLLQVQKTELATGSLDDTGLVGPRVVPVIKIHQ